MESLLRGGYGKSTLVRWPYMVLRFMNVIQFGEAMPAQKSANFVPLLLSVNYSVKIGQGPSKIVEGLYY